MNVSNILSIAALLTCCGLGVVMTALRLPGTWLIVLAALGFGWWSAWQRVGVVFVLVLAGIALVGEALELLSSVLWARKAGATHQAAWGGLIGGILGMFLLSFLVPVPIVGAMIGALLGCFLGAALTELSIRKKLASGTKVGFFSAVGFVAGAVTKIVVALVMSGMLLTSVVCSPPASKAPLDPASSRPLLFQQFVKDGPKVIGTGNRARVTHLQAFHGV